MPFTQWLLLRIPSLILGFLIVGSAVLISILGLLIVRKLIPHHRLKLHNDVAGPIFGTIGVVYAVLLAFTVVIVWENFDKTELNVQKEANCLVDLYRDAEVFPLSCRQSIRKELDEYAKGVTQEEWKAMAIGEPSASVNRIVKGMWQVYSNYLPQTETEKAFFQESVHKLNELDELRRMRLIDARTGVNELLWFVLVVGGLITIFFAFIFGAENLKAQIIMTVFLAVLISLILFTILSLDFPFTGSLTISKDIFERIIINR